MNNQPLMLSILLGIILILIIGGVSLSLQKSKAAVTMQQYLSENIDLQKSNAQLDRENNELKTELADHQSKIEVLQKEKSSLARELEKTQKLKETIEDRLKEELIKEAPAAE